MVNMSLHTPDQDEHGKGNLTWTRRLRFRARPVNITASSPSPTRFVSQTQRFDANKSDSPDFSFLSYRRTPIFSGVIAPFSIMLEVPGFTSPWYVKSGSEYEPASYRQNTRILNIGLGFSMAAAILANVAIICRFTELVKPRVSTAVAIFCFGVHDVIIIVILAVFGAIHAVDDGYTYSEAYFTVCGATAASVIVTATLVADYISTKNFKDAGSGLTQKQKELVLLVMALLIYLSLGSLAFSLLLKIEFQTALYFSTASILSIGFGDVVPSTLATKVILFFFIPAGIMLVALVIDTARYTILEAFHQTVLKRKAEYQERLRKRQEAKREYRKFRRSNLKMYGRQHLPMTRTFSTRADTISSFADSINPGGGFFGRGFSRTRTSSTLPSFSPDILRAPETVALSGLTDSGVDPVPCEGISEVTDRKSAPLGIDKAELACRKDFSDEKSANTKDESRVLEVMPVAVEEEVEIVESNHDGCRPALATQPTSSRTKLARMEEQLREQHRTFNQELIHFRTNVAKSEKSELYAKLIGGSVLFVAFWLIGAMVFMYTENWTYFEAFYFCFIAFSTVGYGDFSPKSQAGRAFFVFWGLLGVGVLTINLAVLG
ncbi:voltage-gated potassium channel, partial [Violaceomyces palustris]